MTDGDFTNFPCYFLAAEGHESFTLELLRQSFPSERTDETSPQDRAWRDRLLRSIINAHLLLDSTNSADGAL